MSPDDRKWMKQQFFSILTLVQIQDVKPLIDKIDDTVTARPAARHGFTVCPVQGQQ